MTRTYHDINYDDFILKLDKLIREGSIRLAQAELKSLPPKKIPRDFARALADLARRALVPLIAIKFLNPIVRPKRPLHPKASISEISLYAALLAQVGARKEARILLNDLDGSENPEVYFYWLYILIPEWDYQSAIRPIKKYLRSKKITSYQRLVGQINLAACYIYLGDTKPAARALKVVLNKSKEENANMIYNNALELQAQLALNLNDFPLAEKSLQEYISGAPPTSDIYRLYAEKWQTLLKLKKFGVTASIQAELQHLRLQAVEFENFETLRDLDYHESISTADNEVKNLVYFGTPYASYRKRIQKNLFKNTKINSEFKFDLYTRNKSNSLDYFDIEDGSMPARGLKLKPGQILHRCFAALLQDLYQPMSLGQLFSELFPREYFNPISSPSRTIQTVHRLNNWYKTNSIPLYIKILNNQFSLLVTDHFTILARRKVKTLTADEHRFKKLKSVFQQRPFTNQMAATIFGLRARQMQMLLKKWTTQKALLGLGKGPARIYKFTVARTHRYRRTNLHRS